MEMTADGLAKRLTEKVLGLDCAALAEDAIVECFALDRLRFDSGDRDTEVLRHMQVLLAAEHEAKRFRREAADLRALVWWVAL